MEDPKERLSKGISTAELERRWNAVREIMRDNKVDYLLMRNDEEFLGGYVRWFTDIPARHSYPFTVIFPIDEEMTLINCGPTPPGEPYPPPWSVRGVKARLNAPYFPSVHYTHEYDAELAVSVLNAKKRPTIGLVGKSFIPMNFFQYLSNHIPEARFVDMTEHIDQFKSVKSPEEIELIKECAALQDKAIEHVKKALRPGRRTFEIHAEAQYSVMMQGSERQLILVNSGPQGTPVPFTFRRFQNRVLKEGDQVSLLIEVNGPGGFYVEIARIFSLGEPSQELQDAYAVAVEAQAHTLSLLKPGAEPKEIFKANNDFLVKNGYEKERRLYAHGQGYDMVERPVILKDETMNIQAGHNMTVHPAAFNNRVWATVCDNYIITENGPGPCLHKTPKKIIVLE